MKQLVAAALVFLASFSSFALDRFPQNPNPQLTVGSLCKSPSQFRYPERIPYCSRAVGSELKRQIIKLYDSRLGYRIGDMDRSDFKIDHLIPLCMGGSNNANNLWPQHKSVYEITDPLEPLLCEKMAEGRVTQSEAVSLILRGKNNLDEVPEIIDSVERL